MKLTVVPAQAGDAEVLGPRLRREDREEVMAAAGLEPIPALLHGIEYSYEPRSVLGPDGQPIAIFGVVPLETGERHGSPWLLGSNRIIDHWFEFARRSREEFDLLRKPWAYLTNYIDARNEVHLSWIRWLGFETVELEEHYGVGKIPFWRFEYRV